MRMKIYPHAHLNVQVITQVILLFFFTKEAIKRSINERSLPLSKRTVQHDTNVKKVAATSRNMRPPVQKKKKELIRVVFPFPKDTY